MEALAVPDPEEAFRGVAAAATRLYVGQSEIIDLLGLEFAANMRRMADQFRLTNLRELLSGPTFVPRLRAGLTPESAALTAWTVSGIENYQRLVGLSGWGRKRYERWLGDTLIHLTLSEPRRRRR